MTQIERAQAPSAVFSPQQIRAALALILLLGLALRSLDFVEPWSGIGFKSAFGTYTSGAFAANWERNGIFESGLLPYYWRVELADASVVRHWYTHHPALPFILTATSMALLGTAEWCARLPWLCISLLSILALYRLVRAIWGQRVGLYAALVYAVLPLSAHYATLLWTDAAAVALNCLLLERYLAWMRAPATRPLLQCAAIVFVAGLFDWSAQFVLVGLGLHALIFCIQDGRLAGLVRLLCLPLAAGFAILLHRVHTSLVLSPEELALETSKTLDWVTSLPVPLSDFLGLQYDYVLGYLTPLGAGLVLAGLLLQLTDLARRQLSFEQGLLLPMGLSGLLYVAVFPARSVNHDFFLFLSLPWFATTIALLLTRSGELLSQRARPLTLIAALLLVAVCGRRNLQLWDMTRSDALEHVVNSDWLGPVLDDPANVVLASPGQAWSLLYHSQAPIIGDIQTVQDLERRAAELVDMIEPERGAYFLFDLTEKEHFEELHEHLKGRAASTRHLELAKQDPPLAFDLFDLRAQPDGPPR